jgi:hypothetical protein
VNIELDDEKTQATGNVDPGSLLARAIDKGVPLEQLERLLAMRSELKAEWAKEQFFKSLASFQRDCPTIIKSAKVDFTSKKGSRTRYRYAPLDVIVEAVKELLEKNGFSYTIKPSQTDNAVTSVCEAHHVDGHTESTSFTIPIDKEAYMNDAQKVASAMTYSKRYAFCNAFGIMTGDEDDDAREIGDGGDSPHSVPADESQTQSETWRWLEVGKAPQSYWAHKGNKAGQEMALIEAFGPGTYKVEKDEAKGWLAYRRLGVEAEAGQGELDIDKV